MVTSVRITAIGNSLGIILPKEVLNQLHVGKGDQIFLTQAPDGVRITPYDVTFAEKMDVLEQVMRENRDVLKRLAE